MKTRVKFIRARYLIPLCGANPKETIEDAFILTDGDTIAAAGAYETALWQKLSEKYGKEIFVFGAETGQGEPPLLNIAITPAFVKAHGHDHESLIIGFARDQKLTAWLDHSVHPFSRFIEDNEERLREDFGCSPYLVAYRHSRLNDIYYGITAALSHNCDYAKYRLDDMHLANLEAATAMIIAIGSQDRFYDARILDTPEVALKRMDEALEKFGNDSRFRCIPGPDQLFSNSRALLVPLKKWADQHGTLIHAHSSEEPATTAWFQREVEPGFTPVEYADNIGFMDENVILAHQVNCGPRDVDIIAERRASVVHNPLANTILGSGMPPVIEMLAKGVRVAIATDGSGSADNQNMINAGRLASQYQKALHADATLLPSVDVLRMLTDIPAQVLRFNKGRIAPGMDADFIAFDLDRPNMVASTAVNVLDNLIWAADGSEISHVVGSGRIMKYNHRVLDFDGVSIAKIKDDARRLTGMFADYFKNAPEIKGTGIHR